MNVDNILFPTDLSDASRAALEYASMLAHDAGATLYIVHVGHPPVVCASGFGAGSGADGYAPELDELNKVRDQLKLIVPTARDVRCKHHYLEGNAASEIVDFARRRDIDLIVTGTHGRTGLNHLLMGSVAEAILRRAHCSVLTVKEPVLKPETANS